MSVRKTILAAAALAAGFVTLGGAASAVAQPLDGIAVAYEDLNFRNAAARRILDRRIARAAERVCGEFMTVELRWRALSEACQQDLVASVRAQRDALIGGELYASLGTTRAAN